MRQKIVITDPTLRTSMITLGPSFMATMLGLVTALTIIKAVGWLCVHLSGYTGSWYWKSNILVDFSYFEGIEAGRFSPKISVYLMRSSLRFGFRFWLHYFGTNMDRVPVQRLRNAHFNSRCSEQPASSSLVLWLARNSYLISHFLVESCKSVPWQQDKRSD